MFLTSAEAAALLVRALDAAMPFDFESRAAEYFKAQRSLKIGIVGFGKFGQFLGKRIAQQGHQVGHHLRYHM